MTTCHTLECAFVLRTFLINLYDDGIKVYERKVAQNDLLFSKGYHSRCYVTVFALHTSGYLNAPYIKVTVFVRAISSVRNSRLVFNFFLLCFVHVLSYLYAFSIKKIKINNVSKLILFSSFVYIFLRLHCLLLIYNPC